MRSTYILSAYRRLTHILLVPLRYNTHNITHDLIGRIEGNNHTFTLRPATCGKKHKTFMYNQVIKPQIETT